MTARNALLESSGDHLRPSLLSSDASKLPSRIFSIRLGNHHFFDEETSKLIDLDSEYVDPINIRKNIPGKKIKSIEVLVKVDNDNQNQK